MKPLCSLLVCAAALAAQNSFEVASIKPVSPTDNRVMIQMQPGGRFVANGASVKMLLTIAYQLRNGQITGGPKWIDDDRFEINAKVADGIDRVPPEQFRELIKNLLADRFALRVHEEEKEASIFHLVQAKNGHKLSESKDQSGPNGRMMIGRGRITAQGMKMDDLARMLAQTVGKNVVDRTGLSARYDVELDFVPEMSGGMVIVPSGSAPPTPVDSSGPSLYTALEEKLGLKLEAAKGLVKSLVIDHVAKPTDN